MDLKTISQFTQKQYNFPVFHSSQINLGNTSRSWTDSQGRICKLDGAAFSIGSFTAQQLGGTDRKIAESCKLVLQKFNDLEVDVNYEPVAIVITPKADSTVEICVLAYSKWVAFVG